MVILIGLETPHAVATGAVYFTTVDHIHCKLPKNFLCTSPTPKNGGRWVVLKNNQEDKENMLRYQWVLHSKSSVADCHIH